VVNSPERWNLKDVKSSKPKSSPKKDSSQGDMYFVYDQYNKHAIVDEPEGYMRPISGRVELFTGDDHDNAHEGKQERGTVVGLMPHILTSTKV
jgi:hypothetical protein